MNASQDRLKRRVFLVDDHPLAQEWLIVLINQEADMTDLRESFLWNKARCTQNAT
jgi:hypothetical protein